MSKVSIRGLLACAVLPLVIGGAAVQAQDTAQEIAAVQNGLPVLVDFSGATQPIPAPLGRDIFDMAWSTDGQMLALVVYDENYKPSLFVTGPGMSEAVALDSGYLEAGFGAAFTPDGNILYAAEGVFPADFSGPPIVELRQIAPEAGAQPVTLGQFEHGVGCGGGSPIPADWQLWGESGFGGSYLTLEWTPLGIVHSTSCSGGSASILNPATGEDRPLGPAFDQNDPMGADPISRLTVSPDGTKAAGVRLVYLDNEVTSSLVLIDLASGEVTDVATAGQPDQLLWGRDGTIYYSTRTPSRDIAAGLPAKDRAALAAAMGYPNVSEMPGVPAYTVEMHRFAPFMGGDDLFLSLDAYSVGRMRQAFDGTLVFSVIPNLDAWAQAIVSGQLDLTADATGDQQRALVPVSLFQLPVGQPAPLLVGAGLEQFELRPEAAAG
ncbi:MAG: hypothetical protein JNL34_14525 [Anaerolineae bacterium]|nr:hypothetical protein [Anaerolineae bacterium]